MVNGHHISINWTGVSDSGERSSCYSLRKIIAHVLRKTRGLFHKCSIRVSNSQTNLSEFLTAASPASKCFTQNPCLKKGFPFSHSLLKFSPDRLLRFKRFSLLGQVPPHPAAPRAVRRAIKMTNSNTFQAQMDHARVEICPDT